MAAALLTALLLLCVMVFPVGAAERPDLNRKNSIELTFHYGSEPVTGGSLICTRVGYVYQQGASYGFRRLLDNRDILNLNDPDTAMELKIFAEQNGLSGISKNVGQDGKVRFDDLQQGVYLIRQRDAAQGYEPIRPFLVTLPYFEGGEYRYHVDASVKAELDKEVQETTEPTEPTESTGPTEPSESTDPSEPSESTEPTEPTESTGPTEPSESTGPSEPTDSTGPTEPTESTGPSESTEPTNPTATTKPDRPDLPQTGQLNWPIPVLCALGGIMLLIGVVLLLKSKREEHET